MHPGENLFVRGQRGISKDFDREKRKTMLGCLEHGTPLLVVLMMVDASGPRLGKKA
ncbi:MAG: hypothetical protein ABIN37_05455 [Burkholderiaceae bacterium]